jgi:4-hydroxybenzoate polyprenyltransferase
MSVSRVLPFAAHQQGARAIAPPLRPRWRSHLLLARVSNLPTVWSNVVAGMAVTRHPLSGADVVAVSTGMSLLYCAGMYLNDALDAASDLRIRPDRPIPAGDVSRAQVVAVGCGLLSGGLALIGVLSHFGPSFFCALLLAGTILLYDVAHKNNPLAPLVMGLCRGLVYCASAMFVAAVVPYSALLAASAIALYVMGLTYAIKLIPESQSRIAASLIAGIALVDGAVIVAAGGGSLALVGPVGFLLTLALQRYVPGT